MRVPTLLGLTAVAVLAAAAPAAATTIRRRRHRADSQSAPRRRVADRRRRCRGGGRGEDHATSRSCFDSAEGFACTGATGAVTQISRHRWHYHQKRVVTGLASFAPAAGGPAIGPARRVSSRAATCRDERRPDRADARRPARARPAQPTLVAEEPVSALYGTLLKWRPPAAASARGRLALRADSTRTRRWATRDRQQPGRRSPTVAASSWPSGREQPAARLRPRLHPRHQPVPERRHAEPFGTIPMNAVPTGVVRGRTARTTSASSPASRSRSAVRTCSASIPGAVP